MKGVKTNNQILSGRVRSNCVGDGSSSKLSKSLKDFYMKKILTLTLLASALAAGPAFANGGHGGGGFGGGHWGGGFGGHNFGHFEGRSFGFDRHFGRFHRHFFARGYYDPCYAYGYSYPYNTCGYY
jgi:hypothetical protein